MAADHVGYAIDQLGNRAGNAAVDHTLHDCAGAEGGFFRRLGNDRTASSQRSRHFLAHQIYREVPGRKGRDRTDGLLEDKRALSGRTDQNPAIATLCLFCEIIKLRGARQHFGTCFRQRFALFGGQQHRNIFGTFADQAGNLVQNCGPLIHVNRAPVGKSPGSRFQRLIQIGWGCQWQIRNRGSGCRIDNLMDVASFAAPPVAVNVKSEFA